MKHVFAVVMLLLMPLNAQAGAIEKLKTFISATRSAQANFTQEVLDQNGKRIIVGDGAKFWLYDKDLNQVSVKKLDAALGSSPAALLAGSNEIERGFTLKENGNRDGLDWLQATPKGSDSSFSAVYMAFDAQAGLVVMELNDAFGHKTVLRFSGMQANPKLAAGQFKFTPPVGADVVSD
jgi:outer membrane lipoprotein carrier protein